MSKRAKNTGPESKPEAVPILTLDGLASLVQRARQGGLLPGDTPLLTLDGKPLGGLLLPWRGRLVSVTPK